MQLPAETAGTVTPQCHCERQSDGLFPDNFWFFLQCWCLNNLADMTPADEWDGGTRLVYKGDQPFQYLPPGVQAEFKGP